MTLVRPPLSVSQALDRIAGQLPGGWIAMAVACGRAESTVRNWGNPGTPESVPLECAIVLDLEFRGAGGVGAPLHDVYALLLETGTQQRFACQTEIAAATIASVRESADAHQALIACALADATDRTYDDAIRELEQDIEAGKTALALVRSARAGAGRPP